MTPTDLRRLKVFSLVMGRAFMPVPPKRQNGGAVDITLRMSRVDLADLAWVMSRSAEAQPGAWTMPQIKDESYGT